MLLLHDTSPVSGMPMPATKIILWKTFYWTSVESINNILVKMFSMSSLLVVCMRYWAYYICTHCLLYLRILKLALTIHTFINNAQWPSHCHKYSRIVEQDITWIGSAPSRFDIKVLLYAQQNDQWSKWQKILIFEFV